MNQFKSTLDILQERRKNILLSMYVLCLCIFSVINIKNIYFHNKIEIILLGVVSLTMIVSSYLFLYRKKKYDLATYSILFIIGYTIILAIILNKFNNFMPAYLITFYLYSIISVNFKKGILINIVFTVVFIIASYINKDYFINSQFLNNKIAIANFLIISTIILSFIVYYEQARIDTYKMLVNSNNEKDLLYREIHHRVKNNLNMISSMMSMQFDGQNDDIKDMIKITKDRINSIAMVHSMLYITNNIEKVDASKFIKNLTNNILKSSTKPIAIKFKLEQIELSLNEIIPIGLITNELITNSIQHAFQSENNPKITIVLKEHKNHILLTYGDNGPAYKKGYKHNLGLMLVNLNTEQLKGSIKVKNTYGLIYKLKYKKKSNV